MSKTITVKKEKTKTFVMLNSDELSAGLLRWFVRACEGLTIASVALRESDNFENC